MPQAARYGGKRQGIAPRFSLGSDQYEDVGNDHRKLAERSIASLGGVLLHAANFTLFRTS